MHLTLTLTFFNYFLILSLILGRCFGVVMANRWCVTVTCAYTTMRIIDRTVCFALDTSPIPTACIHGQVLAIVARTLSAMSYNSRHKLFADSPSSVSMAMAKPMSAEVIRRRHWYTHTWPRTFGSVPATYAHRSNC